MRGDARIFSCSCSINVQYVYETHTFLHYTHTWLGLEMKRGMVRVNDWDGGFRVMEGRVSLPDPSKGMEQDSLSLLSVYQCTSLNDC